jgi:hypothetical protein
MNRRAFITASTAAAVGFSANSVLSANAQEKAPMGHLDAILLAGQGSTGHLDLHAI